MVMKGYCHAEAESPADDVRPLRLDNRESGEKRRPKAKVQVDLGEKTVSVETTADETSVKESIATAGYDNEGIAA